MGVLKTDNLGNVEWHNCVGGSGQDFARYAIQKEIDTYIIIGTTWSNDGEVSGNHGARDAWVFVLNSMGILQWQKCYGGSIDDSFRFILDDGENYILVGDTESNDGDVTENHGAYDLWIVKSDFAGAIIWQKTYGGSNTETASRLHLMPDESILAMAYTGSNDGDVSGNHGETNDVWVLKLLPECPLSVFYLDADADGFGDLDISISACSEPLGFVSNNTDCNDSNNLVNPGATEVCNDIDDNCNGFIDEGVLNVYFVDSDDDGFGDIEFPLYSCLLPIGYVNNNSDCNDSIAEINPDAIETCNTFDDNCNGFIDEGVLSIFYEDADNDGYGNPLIFELACVASLGYVINSSDCDDLNGEIYPTAIEVCNNLDDDCDGNIDDGLDFVTFFVDEDEDGYGDILISVVSCSGAPEGFVLDSTDCDDNNSLIYPGGTEYMNGIDDNCDGIVDNLVGVDNSILANIFLYPNPAHSFIFIKGLPINQSEIEIFNSYGELEKSVCIIENNFPINIEDLPSGIYFIKIKYSDSAMVMAFTKQ